MKKRFRIISKANNMSTGYKSYSGNASSFWFDDFDTNFRTNIGGRRSVDHTKLAGTQRAIANFVNIVTGKQIPVVFQSSDDSYTDGHKVVIGTKLENKDFDPAVGLALHEGSHILLTNFDLLYDFHYTGSTFHQFVQMQGCDPDMNMSAKELHLIKDLFNWVEDRRIDFHVYTTAPGYRKYYEAMYNKYFNAKIIDKALQSNEKTDEDLDSYLFRIINITNSNRNLNALKGLRDIWKVLDLRNINRLKNSEDALIVACGVYKILKKHTKAAEEAQKKQEEDQDGQPDDQKKDKKDCNSPVAGCPNSKPGGENKPKTPEGEAPNDDGTKATGKDLKDLSNAEQRRLDKAIKKQKEFNSGQSKKIGKLSKKDKRIVQTLKESGTESVPVETKPGQPDPVPVDTIVIKKMTPAVILSMEELFETYQADQILNGGCDYNNSNESWYYRRIVAMDEAVNTGIILGKQLGRKLYLRNEEKTLKSTRLKTGKIDRRLISQLGFNNASVFHRIVTDKYKNFFIHISIDASGSMNGNRLANAVKSAVAVAQAASMTTGIRVQISLRGTATFEGSNKDKTVTLYAYDSASDKMSKIKTYFKFLKTFGMTPEGVAFESMFRDIKKDAKGDECIFINYSDGMPSRVSGADWDYNGIQFTRRTIKKMREIGINVIGYFIDGKPNGYSSDRFREMYGQDSEFIDTSNMTKVSKSMNQKFLEISEI